MNYEAFEKIQKKVAEIQNSISALCDSKGVPDAQHAAAISVLTLEIENLKSSLGGKKRRKRTAKATTEPKTARKKPGPKPKAVQAA